LPVRRRPWERPVTARLALGVRPGECRLTCGAGPIVINPPAKLLRACRLDMEGMIQPVGEGGRPPSIVCGLGPAQRLASIVIPPGTGLSCAVTVGGDPSRRIDVTVHHDALKLAHGCRPPGSAVWTSGCQLVPLTWTPCHFGGTRPCCRAAPAAAAPQALSRHRFRFCLPPMPWSPTLVAGTGIPTAAYPPEAALRSYRCLQLADSLLRERVFAD
jgi:hypothetical protein